MQCTAVTNDKLILSSKMQTAVISPSTSCRPTLQCYRARSAIRRSVQVVAQRDNNEPSKEGQSGNTSKVTSRRDLLKSGATLGFGGAAAR